MRILLVEDEKDLREALRDTLAACGYTVECCANGPDGLDALCSGGCDLALLDRMLPGMDGVQLLRCLRERRITTPVLMITAMANIGDRVEGLDAGADDYLVKPFAVEELLARVRALGRRALQLSEPERLQYGKITLNADRGFLQHENGASCALSKREANLLAQFMRNPGKVLPRGLLLSRVWGDAPVEGGNLDNYIYFLRKRLGAVGADVKIATVHGIGFRLERV